jgi:hypothetical protein
MLWSTFLYLYYFMSLLGNVTQSTHSDLPWPSSCLPNCKCLSAQKRKVVLSPTFHLDSQMLPNHYVYNTKKLVLWTSGLCAMS